MSNTEGRICHDCENEIEEYQLRVRVDRPKTNAKPSFYHADCYNEKDASDRILENSPLTHE